MFSRERIKTSDRIRMRQKMSGRPPQPEKAEAGGPFFIFCIPVLDNPHTTVYNKDKERRYPCKRLAPHQFKSLQKVMTATGWKRWAVIFLCFFLCILVLDNPRTAVYNKNKERRYPCKRLAPHQSSITKVMTATGWKRWAVISFCAFSFCCHKNHPFSGRPSDVQHLREVPTVR